MSQIQWKGLTFNQVYSFINKNTNSNPNIFLANPIKHYRREIANQEVSTCNIRTSTSIDILNRPNGTINNTNVTQINGLVNTLDNNLPNNSCETFENCNIVLSPADNAKRRVRSSGMIKRKFDHTNNNKYYTSTSQYLVSRELTFQQNQYNYFRTGNSLATPGSNLASANVYAPQGSQTCKKYNITTPTTFQYKWIDNTDHTVTIPIGYYELEDINIIFKQTMYSNLHFFIIGTGSTSTYSYKDNLTFLLNIGFNTISNLVELQVFKTDTTTFSTSTHTIPHDINGQNAWTNPAPGNSVYPAFIIDANNFRDMIGMIAGQYPSSTDAVSQPSSQTITSTYSPSVRPIYRALYYKPNNSQFGQQGAVSSSDLITRKKYNSITNSTVAYRSASELGASVANALAYGVPSPGYTVKDKIGYPVKQTPTFTKYSPEMKKCSITKISNAI
jgi:hypothetical protein